MLSRRKRSDSNGGCNIDNNRDINERTESGASIFVTQKITHNSIQYYAWKVAYVISLIIEHTYICFQLAIKLFRFLIAGTRVWVFMVIRLFAFIGVLMPGWMALLRYFLFDSFIIRNIDYGKGARSRNLLDVYLPLPNNPTAKRMNRKSKNQEKSSKDKNHMSSSHKGGNDPSNNNSNSNTTTNKHRPVIVFVSGGAWIIGYKLWSALMARELSRAGYVVVVPDYRNFPQGDIRDMIADLRAALLWTTMNCALFGGDPEQIILAGQSAGAHISLCTLVELYEESLAQEFTRHTPHAINLANRTIHYPVSLSSSDQLTPASKHKGDNLFVEDEETQPSMSSIWRDAGSLTDEEERLAAEVVGNEEVVDGDEDEVIEENDEEEDDVKVVEAFPSGVVPTVSCSSQSSSSSAGLSAGLKPITTALPFFSASAAFTEYAVCPGEGADRQESHIRQLYSYDGYDEQLPILRITDIKMFIGISGPYNMVSLMQHLHARGLDVSILHYIFAFGKYFFRAKGDVYLFV